MVGFGLSNKASTAKKNTLAANDISENIILEEKEDKEGDSGLESHKNGDQALEKLMNVSAKTVSAKESKLATFSQLRSKIKQINLTDSRVNSLLKKISIDATIINSLIGSRFNHILANQLISSEP